MVIPSFYIKWTANQAKLYQTEYGQLLREELGFTHGSPYVMAGEKKIEVFTIYPKKEKLLHAYVFREGDILISESITGFYKLLFHSKGNKDSIDVVDAGDGLPIKERDMRTLTFKVPE